MIGDPQEDAPKAMFSLSGDPPHFGHVSMIEEMVKLYGGGIVALGINPSKKYTFTLEERLDMLRHSLAHIPNLEITSFRGLAVDHEYEHLVSDSVRSVRNQVDIDAEKALEEAGKTQRHNIRTKLLHADPRFEFVSSTVVKALKIEQGFVHELVPLYVNQRLNARLLGQYVVGVTGEMGTGKSYVCRKLEEIGKERGILVYNIELDHIPHKIYDGTLKEPRYAKVRQEIINAFGDVVSSGDGLINRVALGEIVFNNPEKLKALNKIVSEPIEVRLKREMYGKKGVILINAALIAESEMGYLCNNDFVLVGADGRSQARRLEERGLTQEQIERRLSSQYNYENKKDLLQKAITRHNQGELWIVDNPDGSGKEQLYRLFDKIIEHMDIYGELRFSGLWNRIGADGMYDQEYKRLVETYSQTHRSYHALPHIVNGLKDFEEAREFMENPDAEEFSWDYHDIEMKKKSKVDEERSAQTAYAVCKAALLPEAFGDGVKRRVRATKHDAALETTDEKIIADIDLAIFGKSPEEFDSYERKIREEYDWVEDKDFAKGRAELLQRFLDRPSIYLTTHFRDKYEAQARENLQKSISKLKNYTGR